MSSANDTPSMPFSMPNLSICSSRNRTGSSPASGCGHVLEHVLRRELELVERLAVAQALAQELVGPRSRRGRAWRSSDRSRRHRSAWSCALPGRTVRWRGTGLERIPTLLDRSDPYACVRELLRSQAASGRAFGAGPARMDPDEPEDGRAPPRRALPDRVPLGTERSARRGQGRRRLRDLRERGRTAARPSAPRPAGCPNGPSSPADAAFEAGDGVDDPLQVLDLMVDAVTLDSTAVGERARARRGREPRRHRVRVPPDTGRRDGASSTPRTAIPLRRWRRRRSGAIRAPAPTSFAGTVTTGEVICVPQVPQRELRRRLHPELHEHLQLSGCYSAVSAPIGTSGALLVTRDLPGRPYTNDDVAFIEAIARAGDAGRRTGAGVDGCVGAAPGDGRAVQRRRPFDGSCFDSPRRDDRSPIRVAVLDLDLRHVACSKGYATLVGEDADRLTGVSLRSIVRDGGALDDALAPVLSGEIDFRSVELEVLADEARVALARRDGAPRRRVAAGCRGRRPFRAAALGRLIRSAFVPGTADWGHATELDDIRAQVAIAGIGETAYTKASGRTAREIGAEAAERAIADAGLDARRHRRHHVVGRVRRLRRRRVPRALRHDARDVDVAVGWRDGVGRDRAVPRRAGDRRGQGAPRAQRVPRGVGDAARVDDGRPGRGARRAVVEAEPRSAVRLVPAADLLRVDHAPAHDRVRHHGPSSSARSRSRAAATRTCIPTR